MTPVNIRALWPVMGLLVAGFCAPAALSAQASEEPGLWLKLGAGVGVGARAVSFYEARGESKLSTRPYPTLGLSLRAGAELSKRFSLGMAIDYETSLGLRVSEATAPTDTGGSRTGLRSHDLRAGLLPGFRFGSKESGVRLYVFAGWMIRGLRAVGEINLPAYTLHGPLLRPEVELPFGHGAVTLRAGPELTLIVSETREFRERSGAGRVGFGAGGALAVDVRVLSEFHVVAAYQALYIRIDSSWGSASSDLLHEGIARVELHY